MNEPITRSCQKEPPLNCWTRSVFDYLVRMKAHSVIVQCLTSKWKCISRTFFTIHCVRGVGSLQLAMCKANGLSCRSCEKIGKEITAFFSNPRRVDIRSTGLNSCERYSCYKMMQLLAIQSTNSCPTVTYTNLNWLKLILASFQHQMMTSSFRSFYFLKWRENWPECRFFLRNGYFDTKTCMV